MSSTDDSDRIFKALADGRRRRLLDLLKDAPQTTGALCAAFPDLDRCTVMQHMKVLEAADLIIVQRKGRERWNHLNALPIREIYDRWIGDYAENAVNLLRPAQNRSRNTAELKSNAFVARPTAAFRRSTLDATRLERVYDTRVKGAESSALHTTRSKGIPP